MSSGEIPVIPCHHDSDLLCTTATSSGVCISCPASFQDSLEGSSERADCECIPGYTGENGVSCTPCPAGYYKVREWPDKDTDALMTCVTCRIFENKVVTPSDCIPVYASKAL